MSPRLGEEGEAENEKNDTRTNSDVKRTREINVTTNTSGMVIGGQEGEKEDPVVQSAVMLRFGAELPFLVAAGKCNRTVQFPIPDDWNDPEVRVRYRGNKINQ